MAADTLSLSPQSREGLIGSFGDPFRTQVYVTINERPGATVAQVARRLDQPAPRVRRQIDRLLGDGLLVVDNETSHRNARERHYRALVTPTIKTDDGADWSDEFHRNLAYSLTKMIVSDISRALRNRTFGTRYGHCEIRIPGEVDERGWTEIGQINDEVMREMEATMIAAARRLEEAGESGIEVISSILLFEAPAWDDSADARSGPRPSLWAPSPKGPPPDAAGRLIPDESVTPTQSVVEAMSDQITARVFIAVAERPGATIGQVARRTGVSPRRVRHQVERLLEARLIVVDSETPRRNARERHYQATALPVVVGEGEEPWTDAERRKIAMSVLRVITGDLDDASRERTLGSRPGYSVIRIPGEVDQRGWDELSKSAIAASARIEEVMVGSVARLEEVGRPGIEALSCFFLFEALSWEPDADREPGPRPTHWLALDR
jgi:DNA-binding transcriptional ArsR family regulator